MLSFILIQCVYMCANNSAIQYTDTMLSLLPLKILTTVYLCSNGIEIRVRINRLTDKDYLSLSFKFLWHTHTPHVTNSRMLVAMNNDLASKFIAVKNNERKLVPAIFKSCLLAFKMDHVG